MFTALRQAWRRYLDSLPRDDEPPPLTDAAILHDMHPPHSSAVQQAFAELAALVTAHPAGGGRRRCRGRIGGGQQQRCPAAPAVRRACDPGRPGAWLTDPATRLGGACAPALQTQRRALHRQAGAGVDPAGKMPIYHSFFIHASWLC